MSLGLGTLVLTLTAELGSEMAVSMAALLDGGVESSLDVGVFHDDELLYFSESFKEPRDWGCESSSRILEGVGERQSESETWG
jgi:hypothetical protein